MPFLLRFWKPLTGAALLALVVWQIHAYGCRREEAGRSAVQAMWEADSMARDKAMADAIAAQKAAEEAWRKQNEVIESEYQARIASIAADRDSTYRLLQQARSALYRSAAEDSGTGVAPAAGQASGADRLDRLFAGSIEECRANIEQLDALIEAVRPQVE